MKRIYMDLEEYYEERADSFNNGYDMAWVEVHEYLKSTKKLMKRIQELEKNHDLDEHEEYLVLKKLSDVLNEKSNKRQ